MGHLLSTFFCTTSAFSGSSQLNEGPFHVGTANKFYKLQVRGQVNFQGKAVAAGSVAANDFAVGVVIVGHGDAAPDVITSSDNDGWLVRGNFGRSDYTVTWAPSSDTGETLVTYAIKDRWAGQLAVGSDVDLFLCVKSTDGVALANLNLFATMRLWWS